MQAPLKKTKVEKKIKSHSSTSHAVRSSLCCSSVLSLSLYFFLFFPHPPLRHNNFFILRWFIFSLDSLFIFLFCVALYRWEAQPIYPPSLHSTDPRGPDNFLLFFLFLGHCFYHTSDLLVKGFQSSFLGLLRTPWQSPLVCIFYSCPRKKKLL